MKTLSSFTKQYPISKTIRFALEPIGKTREHISEFIHKDNQIDDNYEKAKKIIDDYHRYFIENVLSSISFAPPLAISSLLMPSFSSMISATSYDSG